MEIDYDSTDMDLIADDNVLKKHPLPWHVTEDEEKLSEAEDAPRSLMIRSANEEIIVAGLFWNEDARNNLKSIFEFIITMVNRGK